MLLLIPPVGLDRNCWGWLSLPKVGVAYYEPPGIGVRRGEPPEASLLSLADEIATLWREPFDVIGVSFGGIIAQQLVLRHPQRVRSLLLAATTATVDRSILLERAEEAERLGMSGVLQNTLRRWFGAAVLSAPHEAPAIAYTRQALTACSPAVFAAGWRAMSEHPSLHQLARVQAPTTCVAGTEDVSTPRAALEAIATTMNRARLSCIEGPHMLHLESPGAFSDAVSEHLAWVSTMR